MSRVVLIIDDTGSAGAGLSMTLARLAGRSFTDMRSLVGSGEPVLEASFEGDEGFAERLHAVLTELDAASAVWRAWEVPFGETWSKDETFWEITTDRLANLIRSQAEIAEATRAHIDDS